ncbi:Glu/Leu/Phe/Val dehydrogenase dimerization domain-containing protein [Reichenbachiella versicolor]|uniref:Glu/Leu/Phe/Val dehydrogenase dimerization domain-containing protein n=1 Tax=Reichenbachiella versicolor TaxID=1821036 RepID=UPI000D6EA582|nr:Glu/Leu/Phe/Val dehydrogenase dimerization domain-containing protein [Reichenbachiella versicolor]
MIATEHIDKTNESLFSSMADTNHEQIVFCHDEPTGLKAIIAIHNTVLGPSMGGTRMWHYTNEQDAITDALRLSRGMTLKNSIAGINAGGGKAVIIGDASQIKNETLMRRFGQFVNSLNGKYYTAEDVNMTTRDMEYVHMETPYVTGLPESMGGAGDPSPYTAFGVYMGMKAAAKKAYGSDSLTGKRILVQGAGNVGGYLVDLLAKEAAVVMISDIFENKASSIAQKHNLEIIPPDKVYKTPTEIYSPCALGATINDEMLHLMDCDIIAGAANNQLHDEIHHDQEVSKKGILYAPDFLINGGGITNVYYEYEGNHNKERVLAQVEKIYDTTLKVFKTCEDENTTPQAAAIHLAEKRIKDIGNLKLRN